MQKESPIRGRAQGDGTKSPTRGMAQKAPQGEEPHERRGRRKAPQEEEHKKISTRESPAESPKQMSAKARELARINNFEIGEEYQLNNLRGVPREVQSLVIGRCPALTSMEEAPPTLIELSIDDSPLQSLVGCPDSLRYLEAIDSDLISFEGANEGIEEIYVSQCDAFTTLAHCPSTVVELSIESCNNFISLSGCPSGVKKLELLRCERLDTLKHLPKSVVELNMARINSLPRLGTLPSSLMTLELVECDGLESLNGIELASGRGPASLSIVGSNLFRSMSTIPEGVLKLSIADCPNLMSMDGSPDQLDSIELYNCDNLDSITGLPFGLRRLMITGCEGVTALPALPYLDWLKIDDPLPLLGVEVSNIQQYQAVGKASTRGKSARF